MKKQLILFTALAVVAAGGYYLFGRKKEKKLPQEEKHPNNYQDSATKIRSVMHHAKELAVQV